MTDAPREFEGWTLFPTNALPPFHSDAGSVTTERAVWPFARSMQDLRLFLFTDLTHPDDPDARAIYVLDCGPALSRLCERLTGGDAP